MVIHMTKYLLDDNIALILGSKDSEHLGINSLLDVSTISPLQTGDVLGTGKEETKELVTILDQFVLDGLCVCVDSAVDLLLGHNNTYL